jgi:hypothetical protein
LEIAGGSASAERELVAGSLAVEIDDGGRVRSRRCAGLPCSRRSEEDWRPREDIGFLLRRAEEGEERCEAGSAVMIMRCRS